MGYGWVIGGGAIVAAAGLLRWVAWLLFCRWLVSETGDSASLRDAARAARGYRDDRRRSSRGTSTP